MQNPNTPTTTKYDLLVVTERSVSYMLMTPEQKIQELVLYFNNLNLENFSTQELLNLLHTIDYEKLVISNLLENKKREN